jgi:hypothetical protein
MLLLIALAAGHAVIKDFKNNDSILQAGEIDEKWSSIRSNRKMK